MAMSTDSQGGFSTNGNDSGRIWSGAIGAGGKERTGSIEEVFSCHADDRLTWAVNQPPYIHPDPDSQLEQSWNASSPFGILHAHAIQTISNVGLQWGNFKRTYQHPMDSH